jgi:phospholipid/cholesterol/gamma-HCH transport system substrate-binding protein
MKNSAIETIVGASVILIAIVFLVYAYNTGEVGAGKGGYKITAQFENIDGVSTGTDVRMSGVKIGSVVGHKLDFKSYEAIVTLMIDKKLKLPEDSTAKISSEGLLGGNYISLEAGGSEKMLAEGGNITNTQSSINILSLIGQAVFGKEKK